LSRWWPQYKLAFGICVLGACSHVDDDGVIDVVHDACAPIGVQVTEPVVATAVQTRGVSDALSLWAAHGIAMAPIDDATKIPVADTVPVRFESAAEAFHGVYDDENGVIYINSKITDPHALAVTLAHELGHAMGLVHVDGEPSLMNKGNTSVEPTPADMQRLTELWGACSSPSRQ
jgi:hypothetical protein